MDRSVTLRYCISLLLSLSSVASYALPSNPECKSASLPDGYVEWRHAQPKTHAIEFGYGNETCSSIGQCFGVEDETRLFPQIRPIQLQPGDRVVFQTSPHMDISYLIFPVRVDEAAFASCDVSKGQAIVADPTTNAVTVPAELLQEGPNYFITNTSDSLLRCDFGLRINITVKIQKCNGPGGDPGKCWDAGRCVSTPLQPSYKCLCCNGFTGEYCSEEDGCANEPCKNGGECLDMKGSSDKKFACKCPPGWHGDRCESAVSETCTHCANNATCIGAGDDYECKCPFGFTGHHCEVDIDDCSPNPCANDGKCVDQLGGYLCFCKAGYGGHNCDQKFSACSTNPCKNNGYCIDRNGDFQCDCDAGYTGKHCTEKVNLCDPPPCFNATQCVDLENTFECVCAPGFRGTSCEVDINECESNPCHNRGKCYDDVAGYRCICRDDYFGKHCEYASASEPQKKEEEFQSSLNFSQTEKLYIVAATLAGALIIALSVLAVCYCKVHETYKIFTRKRGGYERHTDSQNWSTSQKESTSRSPSPQHPGTQPGIRYSSRQPHPDPDAIINVSSSDPMKNNLVPSLKPKRV